MSIFSGARAALYTLIESAWSGVSTIWDVENANRYNWSELIDNWEQSVGSLEVQPPFAVMRCMEAMPSESGPVNGECYDWPVYFYYVTGLRTPSGGAAKTQEALMAEIEDAAVAMTAAVRGYASTAFSVVSCGIDNGDASEVNQFMLAKALPFYVGCVKASLSIGLQVS